MEKKILIIGAGIAGLYASKSAREADKDCKITLLEMDNLNTYTRTRIPHYISGETSYEEMTPYGDDWYDKNRINLIKQAKVTRIDINKKEVFTDKSSYHYDKLIITTGSSPFKPPIKGVDMKNIMTLRTIHDADNVINLAKNTKACTIIGGGLLGLEIAYSIRQLGCEVNVVEINDRLLPRQSDDIASSLLLDALKEKGINVYLNGETEEFCGDGTVAQVKLKDGRTIDTGFVLLSMGVRANIAPFQNTGLDIGRAIKVDEYMRTNIEGIYAAGDAAEFKNNNFCIWPIAIAQGKVAGSNAAGKPMIYEDIRPHTQLKIHGITLFTIGNIFSEDCDVFQRFEKDHGRYIKFFLKNGIIEGAIVFGEASLPNKVRKAVESKKKFEGISNIDELLESL
ncbi:NAD(P)/FAD-dependent oxidoreductase [Lutispora thermophila]|uniref:Nitrite reductase (NADH) large subunit n=1 Tax=Lutispora thermophila DSM 19022 TaxID=1122184 RepID=A0A1M6DS98_9FIRM|nr:FAD-dependent oxidoreductase [Lutispora thermophila]SHI76081.1 nitrite reductase (NADH) large subunit [Lutispora thermophila DSM 19022]